MAAFVVSGGLTGRKVHGNVVCGAKAKAVSGRMGVVMQQQGGMPSGDYDYNYNPAQDSYNTEANGTGPEPDQPADTTASEPTKDPAAELGEEVQARVEGVGEEIEGKFNEAQETVTKFRDDMKDAAERNVEEVKTELETEANQFRANVRAFVDKNFSPEFQDDVDYDEITTLTSEKTVEQIKEMMLYSLTSTDRGIAASADQAKEIITYITALEKMNPTAEPNSSSDLFGMWKLVYTSSPNFLILGSVPFVKLGQVYQEIKESDTEDYVDIEARAYVEPFFGPFARTLAGRSSAEFKADLEAMKSGAARLKVKSLQPSLTGVSLLGRSLDSFPSLTGTKSDAPHGAYLDTTFLDSSMRIGRTIANNVFVLVRE